MASYYQIRVEGHLDRDWGDYWLEGLTVTPEPDGATLIAGPVADQPALFGLLKKLHNLALPLLLVERLEKPGPAPAGRQLHQRVNNRSCQKQGQDKK